MLSLEITFNSLSQISTADRSETHRANRTRHTTSSSTQPHAKQKLTNAPQKNLTFTRTHTPPERRTMPKINRRAHRPASQPSTHSLYSHPHARARSPVEPSPARAPPTPPPAPPPAASPAAAPLPLPPNLVELDLEAGEARELRLTVSVPQLLACPGSPRCLFTVKRHRVKRHRGEPGLW